MKFLCEQCKAKYQIADDKIVGRTVRMKCRKCGHLIEVRAAVTETSAAGAMPPPSPSQGALPPAGPSSGGRPGPRGAPPRATPLAASLTAPRAPAAKPDRVPSALAGAFKSNVQREEEISAPFDMSELSPGNSDWYVAVNGVPVGPVRIAEIRRKAAMGAVTEDSLVWQEGLDEWRALRTFPDLVEIVREAAGGGRASALPVPASTPPPKPVSAWPSAPVATPAPMAPQPPRAPAARMAPGAAGAQAGGPGMAPAGRNNVVAINSRLATAERLDEAPTSARTGPVTDTHAVAPLPNPFVPPPDLTALGPPAAPAPSAFAPIAPTFAPISPTFAADPFAAPAVPPAAPNAATSLLGGPSTGALAASAMAANPAATAAPAAVAAPASVAPPAGSQKGPPMWILLILLVIAAAFGITLAIAFVIPRTQPPQAVVVQVPVATSPPTTQPQAVASTPTPEPLVTAPTAAPTATTRGPRPTGTSQASAAGASTAAANNGSTASNTPGNGRTLDLHGIGGGPTIVPTDDPGSDGPKAPGSCLSEGQVSQVIQLHQVGIRRTCWERNTSTKNAVNVSVSLTIGPDGTPQGTTATGDDPAVAKCIENDVRGWHFPAMGCSQKIAVPFKFVRQ